MAKRDYKTVSEWKKAYRDKAKLMNERGYRELQPKEFYRAIFPEGSLQSREQEMSAREISLIRELAQIRKEYVGWLRY